MMSREERERSKELSRVGRSELKLVEAAEVLGISYRQAKRSWARGRRRGERSATGYKMR